MQTPYSVSFEAAPGDSVFPTCWPEFTSYRVDSLPSLRTLMAFRRFVLETRGVAAPIEAVSDDWDDAPGSNGYLLSDGDRLVGTIRCTLNFVEDRWRATPGSYFFEKELRSMFRSERCVEANRLLTAPGDPGKAGAGCWRSCRMSPRWPTNTVASLLWRLFVRIIRGSLSGWDLFRSRRFVNFRIGRTH